MVKWELILQSWWGLVIGAATLVLGLAKAKDASIWIWSRFKMLFARGIKEQLKLQSEQLQLIAQELKPNGGSSLRDAINRIEASNLVQDERLKAVISEAHQGICEFNSTGEMVWANRTYLRLVGRDMTEVVGYGFTNSIHPEDRERIKQGWFEAVAQHRNYEATFRKMRPDGEVIHVSVRATAMRSQNTVVGYMGFFVAQGAI